MLALTKSRTVIVESSFERCGKLATVAILPMIAVHAKHLKTSGIPVIS
jgi:hypothetical protein